jgi:hypothetical protein
LTRARPWPAPAHTRQLGGRGGEFLSCVTAGLAVASRLLKLRPWVAIRAMTKPRPDPGVIPRSLKRFRDDRNRVLTVMAGRASTRAKGVPAICARTAGGGWPEHPSLACSLAGQDGETKACVFGLRSQPENGLTQNPVILSLNHGFQHPQNIAAPDPRPREGGIGQQMRQRVGGPH